MRSGAPWAMLLAGLLARPGLAAGQDDYAVASPAWNGLGELVALARAIGIDLVDVRALDLSTLGPTTPLLIVYPRSELPADDLLRFLRGGGRLALADDFGAGGGLLDRLGVKREAGPVPSPPAAHNDNGNLPAAVPRSPHPLNAGVDQLMTNHPAMLQAPLAPVFDFGTPGRSVVIAGAVADGRVVLVSDPSILIDNMHQFPGNRRFAENLLRYLAVAPGSRVLLLRGDFTVHGRASSATPAGWDRGAGAFFTAFNGFLADLGSPFLGDDALHGLGLLILAATVLALLLIVPLRGRRYDGRWLRPGARRPQAGFVGKVELFRGRGVNYLIPALVFRRELEAALVARLGLEAPAPIADVERAMRARGAGAADARELRQLLEGLEKLAMREARGAPAHVAESTMAGLFARGERLLARSRALAVPEASEGRSS